jgi:hypothetical protein
MLMGEQAVGRRQVLRGAGVAAGGMAVGGIALASPAMATDGHGLSGSWLVWRQDEGDPTRVTTVLSFAAGGVIVSHDISPAGPPFTGTWEWEGDGRFSATIWSGFPGDTGPGSAGPTVRVRLRGRVEEGVLSGTYRVTVFAPTSDEVLVRNTGSFRGRRIDA